MSKPFLLGAALVSAGVLVAGSLMYQNAQQHREQDRVLAEVRAQGEAARVQMERMAKEQEQIRRTLGEAQNTLAAAEDRASLLIRDDFHVSDGIRAAIAEYYMAMGKMPTNFTDAGMQSPDQYRGKTLKSAALVAGGGIELVFDANSGVDGGRIRLLPDLSHAQAMGVQWRCETSDYALIKRALPTCEYKPGSDVSNEPQPAVTTPAGR